MFPNFLIKQMLKKQMKDVPAAEQERIFTMIEKNPDFFMKIATEVQEKVKGGMSQQEALMSIMASQGEKIKEVMGK